MPEPVTRYATPVPVDCRLCGEPTWLGDAHPCCARWAADLAEGRPCRACEASRANQRRHRGSDR